MDEKNGIYRVRKATLSVAFLFQIIQTMKTKSMTLYFLPMNFNNDAKIIINVFELYRMSELRRHFQHV